MKNLTILLLSNFIALYGSATENGQQLTNSRTLIYTVFKDGDSIGSLKVQRIIKDTMTYYQSHLDTRFRVVISVTMRQQVNVTYGSDRLISAVCIRKVNDNITVLNRILWNGKNYVLTNKEKRETIVRGVIRSSMVSMYFTPPVVPDTAVMAESFLELTAPEKTGASKYLTTYKDGNTAVHTYADGRCVLINATADWGVKLKFVLVSDSHKN